MGDPMTTEEKPPQKTLEEQIEALTQKVQQQRQFVERVENKVQELEVALSQMAPLLRGATFFTQLMERFLDWKFGKNWDRGARAEAARRAKMEFRRQDLLAKARQHYELEDSEKLAVAEELHGLSRSLGVLPMDVREVVLLYTVIGRVSAAVDYIDEVRSLRTDKSASEPDPLIEQLLYRCLSLAEKAEDEPLQERIKGLMAPTN
jgi:hypothetical protein